APGIALRRCRPAVGVVDQEIGRRDILVVGRPHALAAPAHRVVYHAAARQRAVAEDVNHEGLALTGRVFQTGADAVAEIQIARLTGGAVAGGVIETVHLD